MIKIRSHLCLQEGVRLAPSHSILIYLRRIHRACMLWFGTYPKQGAVGKSGGEAHRFGAAARTAPCVGRSPGYPQFGAPRFPNLHAIVHRDARNAARRTPRCRFLPRPGAAAGASSLRYGAARIECGNGVLYCSCVGVGRGGRPGRIGGGTCRCGGSGAGRGEAPQGAQVAVQRGVRVLRGKGRRAAGRLHRTRDNARRRRHGALARDDRRGMRRCAHGDRHPRERAPLLVQRHHWRDSRSVAAADQARRSCVGQ